MGLINKHSIKCLVEILLLIVLISVSLSQAIVLQSSEEAMLTRSSNDLDLYLLRQYEGYRDVYRVLVSSGIDLDDLKNLLLRNRVNVIGELRIVNSVIAEVTISDLLRIKKIVREVSIFPDLDLRILDYRYQRNLSLGDVHLPRIFIDQQSLINTTLYSPNASRALVQAPLLWSLNYTGRGIRIAVIDTGIQHDHPWLLREDNSSVVVWHYDVTNDTKEYCSFHGTHVAGIIAAQFNSQVNISGINYTFPGIAPGVSIYDIKVFNSSYGDCESTRSSWIIAGIEKALLGPDNKPNTGDEADIISMSLGLLVEPYVAPYLKNHPLLLALSRAVSMGKLVVVAAGNYGPGGYTMNLLCNVDGVVCVSASADQWSLSYDTLFTAFFSSRGPLPWGLAPLMISAPGVFIISSVPTDYHHPYIAMAASGTSMATPHVSGALALLREALPQASPRELILRIMNTGYLYKNRGLYVDYYPWNRYVINNMNVLGIGDPYTDPQPMVEGFGFLRIYDAYRAKALVYFENYNPVKNIVLSPGSVYTEKIYVRSLTNSQQRYSIYVVGFENYGGLASIKGFIDTPSEISVSPNSIASFNINIKIPDNTAPGTYTGYIVLRDVSETEEKIYKIVLSVTVPVIMDQIYSIRKTFSIFGGLSAEALAYFSPPFPEWVDVQINVSATPSTSLLISMGSTNSLVSLYTDVFFIITPDGVFQNLHLGNFLPSRTGVYIMILGWFLGAYDYGEIRFLIYSSSLSREEIMNLVAETIKNTTLIIEITNKIENYSQKISDLENQISALNSSLREINRSLGEMNLSINTLRSSVEESFKRISDLVNTISNINSSVAALTNSYKDIAVETQKIRDLTITLDTKFQNESLRISTLENNLSDLQRALEKSQNTLGEKISSIENKILVSEVLLVAALVASVVSLALSIILYRRAR